MAPTLAAFSLCIQNVLETREQSAFLSREVQKPGNNVGALTPPKAKGIGKQICYLGGLLPSPGICSVSAAAPHSHRVPTRPVRLF